MKLFFSLIFRPIKYCICNLGHTILWILFILAGGLLGVIFNLISRCALGDMTVTQSLYIDSQIGSFYTYSLVLISSIVGGLFIGMYHDEVLHFRQIKTFLAAICVFMMIFCAVFYSFSSNDVIQPVSTLPEQITFDNWQLFFFIFAILLAIYSLGIDFIDRDFKNNQDLETYAEEEQSQVDSLEDSNPSEAKPGVKI